MKKIIILIILLSVVIVGCAESPTTIESRKNKIEAYLVASDLESNSQNMPEIYSLTKSEKSQIINQISFKLIKGRESVLINFLDYQWSDWREDVGFVTSYLSNVEMQMKKPSETKPVRTINYTENARFSRAQQIYQIIKRELENQLDSIDELYYLVTDSLTLSWQADDAGQFINYTSFTFYDADSEKYIEVTYSNEKLQIKESTNQTLIYGGDLLETYFSDKIIDDISTLIPIDVVLPAYLHFQLKPFQLLEDEVINMATISDLGYVPSDQLSAEEQLGYVKIVWTSDELEQKLYYQLTNEAIIETESSGN